MNSFIANILRTHFECFHHCVPLLHIRIETYKAPRAGSRRRLPVIRLNPEASNVWKGRRILITCMSQCSKLWANLQSIWTFQSIQWGVSREFWGIGAKQHCLCRTPVRWAGETLYKNKTRLQGRKPTVSFWGDSSSPSLRFVLRFLSPSLDMLWSGKRRRKTLK